MARRRKAAAKKPMKKPVKPNNNNNNNAEEANIDEAVPSLDTPAPLVPQIRKRRRQMTNYSIYINRVLRQVHPELRSSTKAMTIMNGFVTDLLERIADQCVDLMNIQKKSTMTSREVNSAIRLLVPGELSRHAIAEGTKAVDKYLKSR